MFIPALKLNNDKKEELKEYVKSLSLLKNIRIFISSSSTNQSPFSLSPSSLSIIQETLLLCDCEVYAPFSDADQALALLDDGVAKVIVPYTYGKAFFADIPKDRVIAHVEITAAHLEQKLDETHHIIAALSELKDVVNEVVVSICHFDGSEEESQWTSVLPLLSSFLTLNFIVHVEGNISHISILSFLSQNKIKPQLDSALINGKLFLSDVIVSYLKSDRPDGLFPTVVVDEEGVSLGLVYSSPLSIQHAVHQRQGIYYSRSRGGLWHKGATSNNTQELLYIELDCDSDALLFTVRQHGAGFCHLNRRSCWHQDHGLGALMRTLEDRRDHPIANSYTNRLLNDEELLKKKILEEAHELIEARKDNQSHIAQEAADLIYFTAVRCVSSGVKLSDVARVLDRRSLRVRRRKGDAKPHIQLNTTNSETKQDK